MGMFLISHQKVDYDELCNELEDILKEEGESLNEFHLRMK